MKEYLSPNFMEKGDKAVLVSPSGSIDQLYINGAKEVLEGWGLNVEIAPHAQAKAGRFAGTIEQRLSDLQNAMDDSEVKLIFCNRGGYGAVHLLEKLDFGKIKKQPKWLVGYSDITALHSLFLKNGLRSVHAPMAKHLTDDSTDVSSIYLKEQLLYKTPDYELAGDDLNVTGSAQGVLFGGNLAVLYSLTGTDYFYIPQDGILFIEDVGERPYQIDRMMWNLKLAGVFDKIKGLIVGSFSDYEEDPLMYYPVYESIQKLAIQYELPVAFGFPVGHTAENYPLLHGGYVNLDVNKEKVLLTNII